MKLTPPNGCILAAYFENELIFTIGEKWDAAGTLADAICDNTSFETVQIEEPEEDMEIDDNRFEVNFLAAFADDEPLERYVLELVPITLY